LHRKQTGTGWEPYPRSLKIIEIEAFASLEPECFRLFKNDSFKEYSGLTVRRLGV